MFKWLTIGILFLYTPSLIAQDFVAVNNWINKELKNFGGNAVLLVYQKEKGLVYEYVANDSNKNVIRSSVLGLGITKPITKESVIRIASCSKWLTAALLMTFVDEGKIKLNDSIGKYLPITTTYGKGSIQIWHCLSHLTAIQQNGIEAGWKTIFTAKNMSDCIEKIVQLPLEGKPGEVFRYGNTGLQIIAAICEKVGNNTFEKLFQQRIAIPCNMPNTSFGKNNVPLAAGGAFSTAVDYMHFLQMILNNGSFNNKQVLSAASVAAMQKNYITPVVTIKQNPAEAGNWGYGFGEWIMNEYTAASPGLFGTFPWVNNQQQYAAILFTYNTNSNGRNKRYSQLMQLVNRAVSNKE